MNQSDRIQEISDKLEIQDLFTRYCTSIDSKQYDGLDSVFTPDAFIDYTASGGTKGQFPEVKAWLETVLALFSVTQHAVTNFEISITGNEAASRCIFYNPMELSSSDGTKQMFFVGGYYNDKLIRTAEGWRITQRIEDLSWKYGPYPVDSSAG